MPSKTPNNIIREIRYNVNNYISGKNNYSVIFLLSSHLLIIKTIFWNLKYVGRWDYIMKPHSPTDPRVWLSGIMFRILQINHQPKKSTKNLFDDFLILLVIYISKITFITVTYINIKYDAILASGQILNTNTNMFFPFVFRFRFFTLTYPCSSNGCNMICYCKKCHSMASG